MVDRFLIRLSYIDTYWYYTTVTILVPSHPNPPWSLRILHLCLCTLTQCMAPAGEANQGHGNMAASPLRAGPEDVTEAGLWRWGAILCNIITYPKYPKILQDLLVQHKSFPWELVLFWTLLYLSAQPPNSCTCWRTSETITANHCCKCAANSAILQGWRYAATLKKCRVSNAPSMAALRHYASGVRTYSTPCRCAKPELSLEASWLNKFEPCIATVETAGLLHKKSQHVGQCRKWHGKDRIKRLNLSANQDTPGEEQIAHGGPSQHIDPMLTDSKPALLWLDVSWTPLPSGNKTGHGVRSLGHICERPPAYTGIHITVKICQNIGVPIQYAIMCSSFRAV